MEIAATPTTGVSLASPSFLKPRALLSPSNLSSRTRVSASPPPRLRFAANRPPPQPSPATETPAQDERHHMNFLVEAFHQKRSLKALLVELSRSGSSALHILARDGDWPFEKLRTAVAILADTGRASEALQVFHFWKQREKSRASVVNYEEIIRVFCERHQMDKAFLIFQDMEKNGVAPSLAVYNVIIHGFAGIKEFHKSKDFLRKITEDGLLPVTQTYNGLIQAYGRFGFYDDMSKCVKLMESTGCFPNDVTYNILIGEFAHGGLLARMEKFYRTLLSKRMNLHSCTLISMLEAYAELGVLEKMEKTYCKFLNSRAFMKDDLIRKIANVYIENYRFARLEEFGNEMGGRNGRSELVWCILLLSSAGLLSRRGMDSIAREMEMAKVRLSTTFTNIFALFYLKIKDFKALNGVFLEAIKYSAEPDMITVGIIFDACSIGYNCAYVLKKWERNAYLEAEVHMKTDPLVMSTFGKGSFLIKCEKLYGSLGSKAKEKKIWTYIDLIRLVLCE